MERILFHDHSFRVVPFGEKSKQLQILENVAYGVSYCSHWRWSLFEEEHCLYGFAELGTT